MEPSKRPFDLAKLDFEKLRHDKRRRWLLRSLPVVIVVGLFAICLLMPSLLTHVAIGQYNDKDYNGANQTITPIGWLNLSEKYKLFYNQGTALSMAGHYDTAKDKLEAALAYAPKDATCTVVYNLVLTLEHAGDHATQQAAVNDYTGALSQLTAQATCFKGTDIQSRIQAKLDAARQQNAQQSTSTKQNTSTDQPSQQQQQQLQQQQQQAQQQRQDDNQFTSQDNSSDDYDTSYQHW